MKARALQQVLTSELAHLDQEDRALARWEAEIESGKWSEKLLRAGMTKRDAQQWIAGARHTVGEARQRMGQLYEQFKTGN